MSTKRTFKLIEYTFIYGMTGVVIIAAQLLVAILNFHSIMKLKVTIKKLMASDIYMYIQRDIVNQLSR